MKLTEIVGRSLLWGAIGMAIVVMLLIAAAPMPLSTGHTRACGPGTENVDCLP